jgi:hypothetical protein
VGSWWRRRSSTWWRPSFKTLLFAGAAAVAAGAALKILGRGVAGFVARSCPRCGRRVARGRVYCEDHLKETIDEYRDRQRDGGR